VTNGSLIYKRPRIQHANKMCEVQQYQLIRLEENEKEIEDESIRKQPRKFYNARETPPRASLTLFHRRKVSYQRSNNGKWVPYGSANTIVTARRATEYAMRMMEKTRRVHNRCWKELCKNACLDTFSPSNPWCTLVGVIHLHTSASYSSTDTNCCTLHRVYTHTPWHKWHKPCDDEY